jgi:hypothetical protein
MSDDFTIRFLAHAGELGDYLDDLVGRFITSYGREPNAVLIGPGAKPSLPGYTHLIKYHGDPQEVMRWSYRGMRILESKDCVGPAVALILPEPGDAPEAGTDDPPATG